jgi:hypothetical protein
MLEDLLCSHGVDNANGQLGQNNTTQFSSPVQIPGTSWSSINAANQSFISNQD